MPDFIKKFCIATKHRFRSMDDSLFSQFLLTYGTMIVITIILIIFVSLKQQMLDDSQANLSAEIWSLIISALIPTTITFLACLLLEKTHYDDNQRKFAFLLFLLISLALIYIAYESINSFVGFNVVALVLGIISLLFPAFTLWSITVPKQQESLTSDGNISGNMEEIK